MYVTLPQQTIEYRANVTFNLAHSSNSTSGTTATPSSSAGARPRAQRSSPATSSWRPPRWAASGRSRPSTPSSTAVHGSSTSACSSPTALPRKRAASESSGVIVRWPLVLVGHRIRLLCARVEFGFQKAGGRLIFDWWRSCNRNGQLGVAEHELETLFMAWKISRPP